MNEFILIALLGGDIYYKDGVWQTNDADGPGDGKGGPTYDRFRVIAGAYLGKKYPASRIFVSGGIPPRDGAPSIASVMKDELVALGVSESRIRSDEGALNTYEQLQAIQRFSARSAPSEKVFIVSNEWQLPRIEAMITHAPELSYLRSRDWETVAAEDVMVEHDVSLWSVPVEAERADPRMKARIQHEKEGTAQVTRGSYRY